MARSRDRHGFRTGDCARDIAGGIVNQMMRSAKVRTMAWTLKPVFALDPA